MEIYANSVTLNYKKYETVKYEHVFYARFQQ